jgi:DNA polymerase III delta prime subunit
MIGQKYLKRYVKTLIDEGNFPRFSIFVGPKGSGKKTFLKEYFEGIYPENNGVDSIRKIIDMAHKVAYRTFIIPDADDMSNAAKNALLKVVEECPNDNYFIMTLEDAVNTLDTIRSRAQIFHMDKYYPRDLKDYANTIGIKDGEELEIIADVCETPGDVNILHEQGVKEFYDFTNLVFDNIADVSLANALKIPNKLSLKDGAEGYDLRLFLRMFMSLCISRQANLEWVMTTSKCSTTLRTKAVNKQMLLDTWIFDIRSEK